jgi:hypothetical protein
MALHQRIWLILYNWQLWWTDVVFSGLLTPWSYLFLRLVAKLLATVPFLWRLLVPGTLYRRLSDWRHHFMCFADVLKLNCSAIHTLRDISIFFVFCIFIFMFIIVSDGQLVN